MPKLYKATVEILIEANSAPEASDLLAQTMRNCLWVDWQLAGETMGVQPTSGEESESPRQISQAPRPAREAGRRRYHPQPKRNDRHDDHRSPL